MCVCLYVVCNMHCWYVCVFVLLTFRESGQSVSAPINGALLSGLGFRHSSNCSFGSDSDAALGSRCLIICQTLLARVDHRLAAGGIFSPSPLLVAMFRHIDNHRLFPAEQKVTDTGAQHNHQAEPDIVCHKDQHEHEGQRHLQHMQQCLQQVIDGQHRGSVVAQTENLKRVY